MKQLLIATTNRGKFQEMAAVLDGIPFEIISLDAFSDVPDIEETGETYAENAELKARHYQQLTGVSHVLADDSGMHVDALDGELGLHTRRWGAGPAATDEEWLAHFLERMSTESDKGAEFVCSAALCIGDDVFHFSGETRGHIGEQCEYMLPGLPLSSVFIAEGFEKPYAELTREEKNAISHRGLAVAKVRQKLLEGI